MSHNSIIRKIIVKLHLYTGLILGLIITLICLSGTAIVYKPELEKLSVKDIAFVKPASRTVSPQTLLENVRHETVNQMIGVQIDRMCHVSVGFTLEVPTTAER